MGYEHPGINTVFIGHLLDCKKTKWGAGVAYNDSTCLRPNYVAGVRIYRGTNTF